MRKSKLIALTLVIAIMLMGAGYAAWQETLTIDNTVSTGLLNIEFIEGSVLCPDIQHPYAATFDNMILEPDYHSYVYFDQDERNDKVTLSVDNLYPGATFMYELLAKNVGSIPATLDSVKVDLSETNNEFDETMLVYGCILHKRPNRILAVNVAPIPCGVKLSELEAYLNLAINDWDIEVGDYIVFDLPSEEEAPGFIAKLAENLPGYNTETSNCLFFHMPITAGNSLQSEFLPPQKFSIQFNFKQFNQ